MQVHKIPFNGVPTKFEGMIERLKQIETELQEIGREADFLGAELQAGFSEKLPRGIYLSLWLPKL